MLFPHNKVRWCVRPAWRARQSEILTLALRGQQKKTCARRLETVYDTTLCKNFVAAKSENVDERRWQRLVHVDMQRFFWQGMRSLREAAPAEAPCTFGYPERPISAILDFLSTDLHLWHPEQLSLAEFQAMQQLEFIFNATLNTDAKNLAIDKLKSHRKSASAEGEATVEHDPVQMLDGELADIVGDGDTEPLPPLEEIIEGATLAPATDEDILLRLLQRSDMVELAKQPGQGRREAAQKMREVSDAFGAPQHLRAQGHQVSRLGDAEHDKVTALARHCDLLEKV